MKKVLLICNEEELEKVNYQLKYMGKPCIADNGEFPRYFAMKKDNFEEIITQDDLFLKEKSIFAVLPA